jgi:PAS domain S-box-containing protein
MDKKRQGPLRSIVSVEFSLLSMAQAILTLVLCYLAAKLGGTLILNGPEPLWPLWPGCAVLVAILLVSRRKIWPILIPAGLAGFVLYDLRTVSIRSIAILQLADIAEILVIAWGVHYLLHGMPRLDSLKAFGKYLFVSTLGSLIGTLIGLQTVTGDRWISGRIDFLSDGLAFLILAPAILGWVDRVRAQPRMSRASHLEAAALFTGLSCLGFGVFVARAIHSSPAVLYSLLPFLLWSALRFGTAGAGTSASIVAFASIWGAVHGRGPFVEIDPITRVISLQLFLLLTAVPFMTLAVVVEERKRQEAVLRESEGRFRLVADTAPVMVWMSGLDKLCTYFNRGWLDFTGRSLEEELGNGWIDGVQPEDVARCIEIYTKSFDKREPFAMEYRLRRYDGEYRWVLDIGVPRLGANASFAGYTGSCTDVTEQKLAADALSTISQRLIRAQEEERSWIARELHDDICQRVATLSWGLKYPKGQNGASAEELKQKIDESRKLVKDLGVDIQALSHRLHSPNLDYLGLAVAAAALCEELRERQGVEIEFQSESLPKDLPSEVALCLFRVLQEAVQNAIKHSGSRHFEVTLIGGPDQIHLSVRDSGSGFDATEAIGGGGLGLKSMRERLKLVQGELSIESQPGKGTTIHARVPVTPKMIALVAAGGSYSDAPDSTAVPD